MLRFNIRFFDLNLIIAKKYRTFWQECPGLNALKCYLWHWLFCVLKAMPKNGSASELTASSCVSSRHWVFHTTAALNITLTTPVRMAKTGKADPCTGPGQGKARAAKAVSKLSQFCVRPQTTGPALAVMIVGVQKKRLATAAMATDFLKRMITPNQ